jgi:hypothetical protein
MMWAVFTLRRNSLRCQVGRYESFTPSHHGLTVERRDTSTPLGVDEDDGRDADVNARGGPNDDDDDECRPTTAGLRSRAASCRSSAAASSSRAPSTWILASCAAPPALHRSIDVFPWLCSYTVVAWWMPSWTGTGTSFPGAATLADRRCIGGVLEVYWRCIGGVSAGSVCREITPPPPRSVQLEWSRRGGLHRCTSDTAPVAWVDAKTWGHLIKFGFKVKLKVKGKRTQQQ